MNLLLALAKKRAEAKSSHSPSRRIDRQNQRAFFQKTSPIENRDLPLFQPNTFATAPIFADRKKFKIFPNSSKALLGSSIDGGTKGSAAH